jgi:integrase
VRLYLTPQLGKIRLTTLKTADIRGMLNRIGQQCQCCAQGWDADRPQAKRRYCDVGKCCQRFPNPARVHHVFRTLRAALGVAVAEEVLTHNVASFAKPTRPRRHRFQTWSVAEAKTLLAAIREHRLYALFAVAIALGMPRSEALGLRWEDVDLVEGILTMAMQLQRVAGKLRHDETKTDDSTRMVALPHRRRPPLTLAAPRRTTRPPGQRHPPGTDASNLGIQPGQARSTALFQLATELPAALLARMLSIHIDVAIAWQRASAGDWMTYAADVSRRTEPSRRTTT